MQQQQQQQMTAEALTATFSEVLANLAFMFADEEPADIPVGAVWLETTIGYRGPVSGTLRFRCTRDFSIVLAANLLGVDPQDHDAESKADDAAKELMNVVCGQLVTAVHGTEDVFHLTIPQIAEMSESPDLEDDSGVVTATFSVDGHLLQVAHTPGDPAGANA